MRIRKKLRESRLRTHLQIRAWLQPKLGKAGERLRLAGRIRLANIWARKHPKRTFACVTGVLSLLLVCSLVTANDKPDNADAHDISTIASMEPLFQGFRTIQSNKGLHRVTMLELTDSGRAIRRELDSLIAISRKSHGDSLRIVRQYRRLEKQTFGGGGEPEQAVATDRINTELPEAHAEEAGDKMYEMSRRFGDEDAFTAVGGIGEETEEKEEPGHGYSEEELDELDAAEAERVRQQQEMEELERSLAESRRHINSYAYGNNTTSDRLSDGSNGMGYTSQDDFARDLEEIQRRSYERRKAIERGLGFGDPEAEEAAKRQRADSLAKIRREEAERNRPNLVIKSADTNADKFHTVAAPDGAAEARLIRAMIDQTTKAREGTRLRFKLLDDVTVSGTKLKKGTYLYGTVTGFSSQRVKAAITSILAGDKFIKVKLSVFDNDGMEGFYVPESSFRDFVKDTGSNVVQQDINIESDGGYGSVVQHPEEQGENQVQYHRLPH